jgi:Fe-Mn family superoxide dismutase
MTMERRTFIKTTLLAGTALMLDPLSSCSTMAKGGLLSVRPTANGFELPPLPFVHNALEPYIDAMTMEIHHGKHHAAYVSKLNDALKGTPFTTLPLDQLMAETTALTPAVRNNGGGHYNHSLFWTTLSPQTGLAPSPELAKAIDASFGSFNAFKEEFAKAAGTVFGSGWAWLCVNKEGKLFVSQTPNQDNPLMGKLVEKPGTPILGLDVWEHAYYLKYQNKRKDYIDAFMNIVNWPQVSKYFEAAV